MNMIYDLIIIGCGGFGSATLYHAAKTGLNTLCIEQYEKGHTKGGTHGETRAFRKVYYEAPAYIPLLDTAYLNWKILDANADMDLFIENGMLEIASSNSKIVLNALKYSRDYNIPIEVLSGEQIKNRFPEFHIPTNMVGVFQPQSGFLRVENCVNYFINFAESNGAKLLYNEKVISWCVNKNNIVQVKTNKASYQSKYLIITTGSWSSELLQQLHIPLKIVQKKLVWFPVEKNSYTLQKHSPCFAYYLDKDIFYGFPNIKGYIKVGRHNGGVVLHHADDNLSKIHPINNEAKAIKQFTHHYLTKIALEDTKEVNCLYDITSDGQFVIDNHPKYPQIAFAAGLSGHGYKMSNILGNILIDLVTRQSTDFDISFLKLKRFR